MDCSEIPAERYAANSSSLRDQTEMLLTLTRSMLAAADEQKWDVVAEVERRRWEIMSWLIGVAAFHEEASYIAEQLQNVLALDRHVIAQGEAGLRELAEKIAGFDCGRRASEAYRGMSTE
jgi:hypothetical protein